jgi:hypothetical protein
MQVVKEYKNAPPEEARRYSPATCSSVLAAGIAKAPWSVFQIAELLD